MYKTNPFYLTRKWKKKRLEVLKLDKHECQYCKRKGRYTKATLVHHVKHLDEFPELALEIYYTDTDGQSKRNLLSTCKDCHETEGHPERLRHAKEPLNKERW